MLLCIFVFKICQLLKIYMKKFPITLVMGLCIYRVPCISKAICMVNILLLIMTTLFSLEMITSVVLCHSLSPLTALALHCIYMMLLSPFHKITYGLHCPGCSDHRFISNASYFMLYVPREHHRAALCFQTKYEIL